MTKRFLIIVGFVIAIGAGFVLINPYAFVYYLVFLVGATVFTIIIIAISLLKLTNIWKTALVWLAFGYTALLSSYAIQSCMVSRIVKRRAEVITALYEYRDKHGHFPPSVQEVSSEISPLRANYVPDSTLQHFTYYTRDLYGFPWVFSSKDSSWGR